MGVVVVAIVGNAAEHSTAVLVAMKGKMDLALGIAMGSSMQIALFVAPVLVIAGHFMGTAAGPGVHHPRGGGGLPVRGRGRRCWSSTAARTGSRACSSWPSTPSWRWRSTSCERGGLLEARPLPPGVGRGLRDRGCRRWRARAGARRPGAARRHRTASGWGARRYGMAQRRHGPALPGHGACARGDAGRRPHAPPPPGRQVRARLPVPAAVHGAGRIRQRVLPSGGERIERLERAVADARPRRAGDGRGGTLLREVHAPRFGPHPVVAELGPTSSTVR